MLVLYAVGLTANGLPDVSDSLVLLAVEVEEASTNPLVGLPSVGHDNAPHGACSVPGGSGDLSRKRGMG